MNSKTTLAKKKRTSTIDIQNSNNSSSTHVMAKKNASKRKEFLSGFSSTSKPKKVISKKIDQLLRDQIEINAQDENEKNILTVFQNTNSPISMNNSTKTTSNGIDSQNKLLMRNLSDPNHQIYL
jgi:hypothetical protein